jgi:hypothetical protein
LPLSAGKKRRVPKMASTIREDVDAEYCLLSTLIVRFQYPKRAGGGKIEAEKYSNIPVIVMSVASTCVELCLTESAN